MEDCIQKSSYLQLSRYRQVSLLHCLCTHYNILLIWVSNFARLQGDLGIPLPEMIFGNNEVKLSHEDGFEIFFRAKDALELVDKTSESNKHIKVAYAGEWGKKRLEKRQLSGNVYFLDMHVDLLLIDSAQNHEEIKDVIKPYDWTYSTAYQGTSANEFSDSEKCIDVDRLKQMEPILFYDENILFEDELADNGTATLTTRLVRVQISMFVCLIKSINLQLQKRVMPSCFFLLLRFFLRVDDVLFRVNDTRIYHQFGTNHIIREYSSKEEHYNAVRSVSTERISTLAYREKLMPSACLAFAKNT